MGATAAVDVLTTAFADTAATDVAATVGADVAAGAMTDAAGTAMAADIAAAGGISAADAAAAAAADTGMTAGGAGLIGTDSAAAGAMSSLAGGGAGMKANQILGAGNLATGTLGMLQAGSTGKAAASASDPFASQRPQYQAQLSQLMANPNAVMPTMPGYQSGLQATERADAAMGFAGGGRAATDIANFNSNFYNQQVGTLSGLAGANVGSPAAAGTALQTAGTNQMTALNTLAAGSSLLWGK